jgi:hypothetical protein
MIVDHISEVRMNPVDNPFVVETVAIEIKNVFQYASQDGNFAIVNRILALNLTPTLHMI